MIFYYDKNRLHCPQIFAKFVYTNCPTLHPNPNKERL